MAQGPFAEAKLGEEGRKAAHERFLESGLLHEADQRLEVASPAGARFEILGVDDGDLLIGTPRGPLAISEDLVHGRRLAALDRLPVLLAVVPASEWPALRLRDVALIGPHLSSGDRWFLPEGIAYRRAPGKEPARAPVTAALPELLASLESSPLSPLAKKALATTVAMIDQDASKETYVTPAYVRRLVRHGWLESVLPGMPAAEALTAAVRDAETLKTVVSYEGNGLRVAQLADAFGNGGWTLVTPERRGYAVELPSPNWHPDAPVLSLVAHVAPGADPSDPAAELLDATVLDDAARLAWWSKDQGFGCDAEAWRTATLRAAAGAKDLAPGFFPPHVLVVDLAGDLRRLETAHGRVVPAAGGQPAEVARFLDEAAKALPDAAHLDLVGEHLFFYCLDSPDTRLPLLVGTDEAQGEVHQTVAATFATAAGGVARGDCDDLAEVFQAIVERQGRLAHIMNLPGHNALGYAERAPDGATWTTAVLQTGPPLAFRADTLPKALEKAYKSFGILEAFDADQVPIAVRFSGENTRSNWVLSWRIFADAAYAKTMIDVQKDWHFHTFRRGTMKMEAMVAAGDRDPANFRELAGLAESTGQYAAAAAHAKTALELGEDPTLAVALRRLADLYLANDRTAAAALADELVKERLPAVKKPLGPAFVPVALNVAGTMIATGKDRERALAILAEHVTFPVGRPIVAYANALNRPGLDRTRWREDPARLEFRALFLGYVGTVVQLFEAGGAAAIDDSPALTNAASAAEQWVVGASTPDADEPGELLDRYAAIGNFYRALLGEPALEALLANVKAPTTKPEGTPRRQPGITQLTLDLPWIRAAVPYWVDALSRLFDRARTTLDRERVAHLHGRIREAHAAAARLSELSPLFEHQLALSDLIAAVIAEDGERVAAVLREIQSRGDKALRDNATQWLGTMARFTSPEWFAQVLERWHREIGHKPGYFSIAWTCFTSQAPRHAVLAADFAARTFPDDPAFAEEASYLRALSDGTR